MRKKLGIIDDSDPFRKVISDIIMSRFPDAQIVIQATNGQEFVDSLSEMADQQAPEVVIMDLNMPLMDGFETARWLHLNHPNN